MSIESVMPSNHLILCCPFLLLPTIFPSIRTFSSESALHIRRPQYWSFSFSIRLSNECSVLISFRIDRFDLLAVRLSRVFSNVTIQKHQLFSDQPSLWSSSHNVIHWLAFIEPGLPYSECLEYRHEVSFQKLLRTLWEFFEVIYMQEDKARLLVTERRDSVGEPKWVMFPGR